MRGSKSSNVGKIGKLSKEGKTWYQQAFNSEWLKDDDFKDWLIPDPKERYKAICQICNCNLKNCNRSGLMHHKKSSKHVKNYSNPKRRVNEYSSVELQKNEPRDNVSVVSSPVKEAVGMSGSVHKKRSHSHEVFDRNEEPHKKISRKIMNFYNLHHSDHETVVLKSLANDEAFMDVTLTSGGKSIKAHKNVLSAMSSYFRRVLGENPCQHPIIVMPRDITFEELKNIITYIYQGEVSVSSKEIGSLLKSARVLEVSGLCDLAEVEVQPDEYVEASQGDEFAEPCLILEEVDTDTETSGGTPKLVAKRGRPKRSYHKRTLQKKKVKDEEMLPPDDDDLKTHEVNSPEEPDPPEGATDSGTGDGLILPTVDPNRKDPFDPIRLFMCECSAVFMQQTLLDDHKKKGCSGTCKLNPSPSKT